MGALTSTSTMVILWTVAGYPLAAALAARLRPRPHRPDPAFRPSITVVVAACNESGHIERRLRDLDAAAAGFDSFDVVMVTDGSTDGTDVVVRDVSMDIQCPVTLVHDPARRGKAAALNRAFPHITGEVVVFTDANTRLGEDGLLRLVAHLADPAVGSATGIRLVEPEGTWEELVRSYETALLSWETRTGSALASAGEALAVKQELLFPIDERVINDDFAIAMATIRQGRRHVVAPDVLAVEPEARRKRDIIARRGRITAGRIRSLWRGDLLPPMRRHPVAAFGVFSHKVLRALLPIPLAIIGLDIIGEVPRSLQVITLLLVLALPVARTVVTRAFTMVVGTCLGLFWAFRPTTPWPRPPR